MKRILTAALLALTLLAASAAEPRRGYRGFVDIGTDINSYMTADGSHFVDGDHWEYYGVGRRTFANATLSSSHGFQFNPHFFLGAGLMGGYSSLLDAAYIGMYAHARLDETFGRYTPYADLRVGVQFRSDGPVYISPTVGYRFNLGRKTNLNVGLGLTLTHRHDHNRDMVYYDHNGNQRFVIFGSSNSLKPAFTFRIGVDF